MRKENPGNAFQYTCPIFDIQKSRTCTTTKRETKLCPRKLPNPKKQRDFQWRNLRKGPGVGWGRGEAKRRSLILGKKEITKGRKTARTSSSPSSPLAQALDLPLLYYELANHVSKFFLMFFFKQPLDPYFQLLPYLPFSFFCPFSICKLNGCFCEFWTVHFFKKCELKSYLTSNCYAFHQLHYVISCELTGDLFPRCLTN